MPESAEILTVRGTSALGVGEVEAVLLPLFAREPPAGGVAAADAALDGTLTEMVERGEFRAELGETTLLPSLGRLPAGRALLLGLGPRAEWGPRSWTQAVSAGARALARRGLASAAADLRDLPLPAATAARGAAAGAELARFVPDPFRTGPRRERRLTTLALLSDDEVGGPIHEGQVLGRATNLARDLVNLPGNVLTPTELARRAEMAAAVGGLACEVIREEQLAALAMHGILAVTRGSTEPACLIVLRHAPRPGPPALALVGKAVTFDTGGISLKPRENMHRMKGDMAGGAAVIAAMQAIGELRLPVNVLGIIPAADNMPGGRAWKPGDVITMRGGKTVEVISTDAEGRMLLADALDYAQHLGAARLVDIATLTGSCVVALGHVASGLYGSDPELVESVRHCGEESGERHWPMPLFPEYRTLNRSDIADLKNSAGRNAGSIGAAWFLREFVDDRPWAHLDIAGTSWQEKGTAWAPAGPTGVGVGTFIALARQLAE
jgi:leucyl aminopeptidase